MSTLYFYDNKTGELIGSREARKDPRTGDDLQPAFSTFEAPPAQSANKAIIYSGGWSLVDDFRGSEYWNAEGEKFTIKTIGEVIPVWGLPNEPEKVLTPQEKLHSALAGMVHDFGDGRVIQVRPVDESNLKNEIERMSRNADEPQSWRMADNTWHLVTAAELQTALESGQDQGRVIWDQYRVDTEA